MKKINLITLLLSGIFILNGCSSFSEVGTILRNEKVKTTDEFLIKKNEPLTQPPDYETIPEPGSMESKAERQESSIEQILKTKPSKESQTITQSSSTEESVLNKIKK
jgi:PBP1b-binding outer membrane lipoprotein LpoB